MTRVIYIVLEWLKIEEAISEAEEMEGEEQDAGGVIHYFLLLFLSFCGCVVGSRFVLCMRCHLYCYAVYKPASHCYGGIMFLLSQQLQALKVLQLQEMKKKKKLLGKPHHHHFETCFPDWKKAKKTKH